MKNLFKYLLISLFLISCEKENTENPEVPEVYSFKEIAYIYTDECDKDVFYEELPQIDFSNNTSLIQHYTFNPMVGVTESSQFASDDIKAFALLSDSTLVSIPVYIDVTNNISLGKRKWLYSNKREMQKPESNIAQAQTISIEPNKQLIIKTKIYFQRYSTTYELTVVEKNTQVEKKIIGKWTGIYPIKAEIETSNN